ncbi:hypothetical protein BXY85_3504 [Roseivirga pacifica]|uniref:DUF4374 domain-containing protein n=1 Tax=Roseivirga pacifica TaxID=1267423 RepID=A0A1I0QI62_9BACT|nr:hypothetical protein [Roseivirga pacifica]RKQ42887.1 hypothetical protein BXY85_3504 [Roseivirga pacifica]SEW26868.1 hypothetical protein SAMN05216290_2371 [Roseivirga pacifica]
MKINILFLSLILVAFSCKDADETPEPSTSIHLIAKESGTSSYKHLVNGKEQEIPSELNSEYTTLVSASVDEEGNSKLYYISRNYGETAKLYINENGTESLLTSFPHPLVFFTGSGSNANSLISGYVEGNKGFYIEGNNITYVGEAEHSMVHVALKDNQGNYHIIYQERKTTYSEAYGANFSGPTGQPKYILNGQEVVIPIPEGAVVNSYRFNLSPDGTPTPRINLNKNPSSPNSTHTLHEFVDGELIEIETESNPNGTFKTSRTKHIDGKEYQLGNFYAFDNSPEESYAYYLEDGEMHKFSNEHRNYEFTDITEIDNVLHIVGKSRLKNNYADIQSLYLVDGEPNELSGIPNLELLSIFKVE